MIDSYEMIWLHELEAKTTTYSSLGCGGRQASVELDWIGIWDD